MQDVTFSLVIGVVSGILTTAILFLCAKIFKDIVIPWYQSIIYKGVKIEGDWIFEYDHQGRATYSFSCELNQHAHAIAGRMKVIKKVPDMDATETVMSLSGELWEGFLVLGLRSIDQTRLSFASCLLKVKKGGQHLEGMIAFRNSVDDEIMSLNLSFKRR